MEKRGSKYDPLNQFLQFNNSNRIIMTFSEIEEVLGFSLPMSAQKYMSWWDDSSQHSQAHAWTEAGYKANPKMNEKKVDFIKFDALK